MTREENIQETILEMHDLLIKININLDRMHKDFYGNGKPGLLENFNELTERVSLLELNQKNIEKKHTRILEWIGILAAAAGAAAAYLKR